MLLNLYGMSNAHTISTVADLQHQTDLLLKEFDYEKEMFRTQTEQEGIQRKIQQGLCWYPISTGRSYYNSLNQLVIEVERLTNKDIEHNFEYGRSVTFFSNQGNNLHYFNFQTTISYVQDDRMVVVLPSDEALVDVAGSNDLGIQISFDETSYKAMLAALKDVMQAKGNRLAELREKLIGNVPEEWLKLFPLRFPLAQCIAGSGRESCTQRQGCGHRSWSSRNRQDDDIG
jgi:ATP-dependent RNA/DNA helicase IGHMBP2